jgi:hypothetical protein
MTYHDKIKHLDEPIVEMLVKEAPHTSFGTVPPELNFLKGGIVDLGFENIPDKQLAKTIYRAFTQTGVRIPGTNYKMRAEFGMIAKIEQAKPNEELPTLPPEWAEYVHVIDANTHKTLYVGSKLGVHQHADKM